MAASRRERYEVHGKELAKRLRCLLCRQWIEADHDEALALERARKAERRREPAGAETAFDALR